jgi:hypothetical protein
MGISLSIGSFSRATHLTVKTLRHYHEEGLLVPAQVDARTGYRRYTGDQIAVAQSSAAFAASTCQSARSTRSWRHPIPSNVTR